MTTPRSRRGTKQIPPAGSTRSKKPRARRAPTEPPHLVDRRVQGVLTRAGREFGRILDDVTSLPEGSEVERLLAELSRRTDELLAEDRAEVERIFARLGPDLRAPKVPTRRRRAAKKGRPRR